MIEGGIFTGGEYSHACRLRVNSTRSARRMRTRILLRRGEFSPSPLQQKKQTTTRAVYSFWSKWRDSNSRPPVPETGALPTALHLEISKLKVENGKLKVNFVVVGYAVNSDFPAVLLWFISLCHNIISQQLAIVNPFYKKWHPFDTRRGNSFFCGIGAHVALTQFATHQGEAKIFALALVVRV